MKDHMDALKANGTAADLLNSHQPSEKPARIRRGALGSSLKILYANPERLAYKGIQSFLARLHILRNSLASLLLNQGASTKGIQGRLGHSSIALTGDLYAHLCEAGNARLQRSSSLTWASTCGLVTNP